MTHPSEIFLASLPRTVTGHRQITSLDQLEAWLEHGPDDEWVCYGVASNAAYLGELAEMARRLSPMIQIRAETRSEVRPDKHGEGVLELTRVRLVADTPMFAYLLKKRRQAPGRTPSSSPARAVSLPAAQPTAGCASSKSGVAAAR